MTRLPLLERLGQQPENFPGALLLTGATPQIIELMLRDMSDQTNVIQEMSSEIAAANYKTTDDVAAAFKAKVIRVQMQRTAEAAAAASSEPTTTQPIDGK